MELVIRKHFGEWGEIENVTIIQPKGVAFVRYKNLANAEFAKEAMYAQSLEGGEIINVRWATDDPNPASIEAVKRKAESDVITAIKSKLPKIGPKGTILDYEDSYKELSKTPASFKNKSGFYDGDTEKHGRNTAINVMNTGNIVVTSGSSAYAIVEINEDKAAFSHSGALGLVAGYASSGDDDN